jgi:hypothetical protein
MNKCVIPLLAALSFGCSAGEHWSDPAAVDNDQPEDISADVSTSIRDDESAPLLGQAQQASIGSGCFASVPPFINDVFQLEIGSPFEPSSFCGGPGQVSHILMIQNYVRALGIPAARPVNATPQECADLQLFVGTARFVGINVVPQLVLLDSRRGEVQLVGGVPVCSLQMSLVQPEDRMPDGEDYYFAVQLVRDGSDGNTEPVRVVETF